MTIKYQRNTYTPVSTFRAALRDPVEVSLDWLSASYNELHEQVISFQFFTITDAEAGLPDAIAKRFYDTEELWWLICSYNGVIDPFEELVPGARIRVPDLQQSTLVLYQNNKIRQGSLLGTVSQV